MIILKKEQVKKRMQYIKERERAVLPSMCDHTAGMSITAVLNE